MGKFKKFQNKVWLSSPTMHKEEWMYMNEAYTSNWMSTVGENINEMERIVDSNEGIITAEKVKPLFTNFEKKSIDFAVMEKSDNICVIPSSFKWNDVGSYEAFDELFEKDKDGNVIEKE